MISKKIFGTNTCAKTEEEELQMPKSNSSSKLSILPYL
jgi:hypothetical protein